MATALNPGLAPLWPLSVDHYHTMIENGILGPDDPVELLEGTIVRKMSKKPPHRIATRKTSRTLEALIFSGWYVDTQEPITLLSSEPEPDVAVIRGESSDYPDRHPGAGDVGLIVEIAETSLERDRVLKKGIYAKAGVPVYWVLDLNARQLEVFSRPFGSNYTERTVFIAGETAVVVLDGLTIGSVSVSDLLP